MICLAESQCTGGRAARFLLCFARIRRISVDNLIKKCLYILSGRELPFEAFLKSSQSLVSRAQFRSPKLMYLSGRSAITISSIRFETDCVSLCAA